MTILREVRDAARGTGLLGVRQVIYQPKPVEDLCQAIAQVLEAPVEGAS